MKPYDDERIRLQKLKIVNEAYVLVMLVLIVSLLVKQFYLHAAFSEYMTEFIAFFGASVYILVRMVTVGHRIYSGKKKLALILVPLVTSIVVTLLSFLGNYKDHIRIQNFSTSFFALLITFVSSFLGAFVVIMVVDKLSRKQENAISKKLDDSDDN